MKFNLIPANFETAFGLLGKRWTGLIIYTLLEGPRHFTEIHNALPHISDRMLAQRLKELESFKVVNRKVYPERPVRIEYVLTQKGYSLKSVMDSVQAWAQEWDDLELVQQQSL